MKISHVINEGMAEDDVGEGIRVPAQQILGTKNRAKTAYYPTNVKPKVPKLDKKIVQRQHTIPPTSSQKFPS